MSMFYRKRKERDIRDINILVDTYLACNETNELLTGLDIGKCVLAKHKLAFIVKML